MWGPTHTFGWIARMGTEVAGLYSHDGKYLFAECAARGSFQICAALVRMSENGLLIDKSIFLKICKLKLT